MSASAVGKIQTATGSEKGRDRPRRRGYPQLMAKKVPTELVVDLRGEVTETLEDFRDAIKEPCGLPD